jgi:hypothetical protein
MKIDLKRYSSKRDQLEQLTLELKQKLCEAYMEMRTFQNQIET